MGKNLNKKYFYDQDSDSLYIYIAKGKEEEYEEIAPGINLEFDKKKRLMGIEILNVSRFLIASRPKNLPQNRESKL